VLERGQGDRWFPKCFYSEQRKVSQGVMEADDHEEGKKRIFLLPRLAFIFGGQDIKLSLVLNAH